VQTDAERRQESKLNHAAHGKQTSPEFSFEVGVYKVCGDFAGCSDFVVSY
jgi:hypothetical protein